MTDFTERPAEQDDEAFERMLEKHAEPTPEVTLAMAELEAARAQVTESLDQLSEATQSALDVPAKISVGIGQQQCVLNKGIRVADVPQ